MRAPMSALFLIAFTVAGSGQSANSAFSIDVTGPKTVKAGESIEIKVVLTNTSDHSLDFKAHEPDENDYNTEVFKSTGRPGDYTTHGLFLATRTCKLIEGDTNNAALCMADFGTPIQVTLRPGGKYITWITVNDQFHLNKPGNYLIRVSRSTAGEPRNQVLVISNTITVTVTP